MDSDAEALSDLDSDADVLVAREEQRIGDSVVAGQLDKIGDDQGVDSLLLSGEANGAEADLNVVGFGKPFLFVRRAIAGDAVVPVDSKEGGARVGSGGDLAEGGEGGVDVESDGFTGEVGSGKELGASGIEIPGIHEGSDAHRELA